MKDHQRFQASYATILKAHMTALKKRERKDKKKAAETDKKEGGGKKKPKKAWLLPPGWLSPQPKMDLKSREVLRLLRLSFSAFSWLIPTDIHISFRAPVFVLTELLYTLVSIYCILMHILAL